MKSFLILVFTITIFSFGQLPAIAAVEHDSIDIRLTSSETAYVHSLNGLKMRYEPSFRSHVYTVLDYGTTVIPLVQPGSDSEFKVGYTSGKWIKVLANGREGYVFDGFISGLPIPEVLPHTSLLTEVLEKYALTSFQQLSTDTVMATSELDDRFYAKYRYQFTDGINLTHHINWQSESVVLEIPKIRIMDAYLLVEELITVSDHKDTYGKDLIFKERFNGEIYEISDRLKEDIIIKKQNNGSVTIEFKSYAGC